MTELWQILEYLDDPVTRGVLLLGEPGAGKTTLLSTVAEELSKEGRPAFAIPLRRLRNSGDLGDLVLLAIEASSHKDVIPSGRTRMTSAGEVPLEEATAILDDAGATLRSPVLLFDGLDESVHPSRAASAIEQLYLALDRRWKFVVTSGPGTAGELRRLRDFRVLELPALPHEYPKRRRPAPPRDYYPVSPPGDYSAGPTGAPATGNPVLPPSVVPAPATVTDVAEALMNDAIAQSANPAKLGELLERLALAGGQDRVAALAAQARLTDLEASRLLAAPGASALVVLSDAAGTALIDDASRDAIITQRLLTSPFRLADLRFGDEEAEADGLLDETYVHRPHVEAILGKQCPVVIGDRGSGKSAIFRKLAPGTADTHGFPHVGIMQIAKPDDLLHKLIADEAGWQDTHKIRAAWLVIAASMVASALPATAPKKLRRDAAGIRAALGFPAPPAGIPKRTLNAASRLLGGTTLKLSAGPAEVELKLPNGSGVAPGKATVDVAGFLDEANSLLGESRSRVVITVDQIDEIAKWDRNRQQAVVRGLLQAVRDVHPREHIQFVVFLRTDLYERCDVQEKTKLVSKTVTLTWEEEDWLQVLVRRVLANEPLRGVAARLRDADGDIDTLAALQVLFPAEIEGQPAGRWLIDSVRNGNGSVSPRLAVNLLSLTAQQAAKPLDKVSALPLFSAAEAGLAMTKLSDLSFDEVVNDFKVAPSFVLSCRAGKLETFAKKEVQGLFNEAEGNVEEQVLMLERLGFLERIVQGHGDKHVSLFRIPRLYTRCWDHA